MSIRCEKKKKQIKLGKPKEKTFLEAYWVKLRDFIIYINACVTPLVANG